MLPLKMRLKEDSKEVEFLKKSITDLTEQLISIRIQLRELTGEKLSDSKSSRAIEFYKNNPGLTRKEYLTGFLELGFGKACAATMYQKVINEYEIPLSKCKTPEGVLQWVYHLTEKTWITVENLRYFIDLVRESSE